MRIERLPYTNEDIARNEVRFRISACGWCGGDPHQPNDCPVAQAFEAQHVANIEARLAEDVS